MKALEGTLDYVIVTITASVDWKPYLDALRPYGVLCFVGAIVDKPLEFSGLDLLLQNVSTIRELIVKPHLLRVLMCVIIYLSSR